MAISSLKSPMKALLDKFRATLMRGKTAEVKSFKENQEKEKAFDAVELGVRQVPIDRIVGSVGRYHDFDGKFRLKQYLPHERLNEIKKAMRSGATFPPVKLYQIKDDYYVFDGNHRVSAAKEFGYDDIDARILAFIPSKNTLESILYHERAEFDEKTGLPHPVELTELGQYPYLLNQISRHREFLQQGGQEPVPFQKAARDWYRTIYTPLAGIIKKAGLLGAFPSRKEGDLYAYISYHQWEKGSDHEYGSGIDPLISDDMEAFRKKMAEKRDAEYPDMLREITAFVLMMVSPKKEYHIVEKLFDLKEVAEVHSVHGDVDILVKIILTRNLMSSDAEIIGKYVHDHIRQIPGVNSTQTLIPGMSKIKEPERPGPGAS